MALFEYFCIAFWLSSVLSLFPTGTTDSLLRVLRYVTMDTSGNYEQLILNNQQIMLILCHNHSIMAFFVFAWLLILLRGLER